jgi:glutamate synthase domain-containing protein 3
MSGGVAYVYDEDGYFAQRCNTAMVALAPILSAAEQKAQCIPTHRGQADEVLLKNLIDAHYKWTGSLRAREILDNWEQSKDRFIKVFPHEYRRAMAAVSSPSGTNTLAEATASSAKASSTKRSVAKSKSAV